MSLKKHNYFRKNNKTSIVDALKASMRMNPEIIYVGEMKENTKKIESNIYRRKSFKY